MITRWNPQKLSLPSVGPVPLLLLWQLLRVTIPRNNRNLCKALHDGTTASATCYEWFRHPIVLLRKAFCSCEENT